MSRCRPQDLASGLSGGVGQLVFMLGLPGTKPGMDCSIAARFLHDDQDRKQLPYFGKPSGYTIF